MHADLQRLLSDRALEGLPDLPIDRLRRLRLEASHAENDVSFVRRVAQGRLDIVGHERARRAAAQAPATNPTGGPSSLDDDAMAGLLFDMPDILADAAGAPIGAGTAVPRQSRARRNVDVVGPGPIAADLGERLDAVVAPASLASVDTLAPAELSDLFEQLREFEVELSGIRRSLHDRIDAFQDEIARRYRDGELSVDSLLDG